MRPTPGRSPSRSPQRARGAEGDRQRVITRPPALHCTATAQPRRPCTARRCRGIHRRYSSRRWRPRRPGSRAGTRFEVSIYDDEEIQTTTGQPRTARHGAWRRSLAYCYWPLLLLSCRAAPLVSCSLPPRPRAPAWLPRHQHRAKGQPPCQEDHESISKGCVWLQ